MIPSNSLESKIPSGTYWRVQLVCIKVQANTSSEPPQEHSQGWQIKVGYNLLNQLRSYINIILFQISPKQKNRLSFEFLEKNFGNSFALAKAEDNTSGLSIRGSIADIPLLRACSLNNPPSPPSPPLYKGQGLSFSNLAIRVVNKLKVVISIFYENIKILKIL